MERARRSVKHFRYRPHHRSYHHGRPSGQNLQPEDRFQHPGWLQIPERGENRRFRKCGCHGGDARGGDVFRRNDTRRHPSTAISALISTLDGGSFLLLDVGLNVDCKPDVLDQYGLIGSAYAEAVLAKANPRVALLNIGESEKGNLTTKAAYELMADNGCYNFVGNIEANEIFTGRKADVVVCDGFVGNTILKQTRSFYELARMRGINDDYIDKLNYEFVGYCRTGYQCGCSDRSRPFVGFGHTEHGPPDRENG